jgi:hypothetical protein
MPSFARLGIRPASGFAGLLALASWSGGCGSGGEFVPPPPGVQRLVAKTSSRTFCCDPSGPFPQAVGQVTFTNVNPLVPLSLAFTSDGVTRAEPDEAVIAAGETLTVTIYVDSCPPDGVSLTVGVESFESDQIAAHLVKVLPRALCDAAASTGVLYDLMDIPPDSGLEVMRGLLSDPTALATIHSVPSVPPKPPADAFAEIVLRGIFLQFYSYQLLLELFGPDQVVAPAATLPRFPCGSGPEALTVCSNPSVPLAAGNYVVAWMATGGTIPLADPNRHLQFGFVFDADGNAANNYVPSPGFANDFYGGSDRWYSVEYTPALGWRLIVTDARNNAFTVIPSGARALIRDNGIVLLVPAAEFAVANPAYRVTLFSHLGNYGIPQPHIWSGDLSPTVALGLSAFSPSP